MTVSLDRQHFKPVLVLCQLPFSYDKRRKPLLHADKVTADLHIIPATKEVSVKGEVATVFPESEGMFT